MYDTLDIYTYFRKAQSLSKGRGYRIPKDWDNHFNNKMKPTDRENLQKITDYFNTKWRNIDPQKFFEAGFEVYKNFTYHQFFDKKVIEQYKRNDKNKKRKLDVNKKSILDNVKFVVNRVEDSEKLQKLGLLRYYCWNKEDGIRLPIKDYLNNDISTPFLVWLMYERYLVLTEEETGLLPYVVENYRIVVAELLEIKEFLDKLKRRVHNG